jgi:hypothetical protein
MSKKSLSPSREECHVESLLTRSLRESPVVGGESPIDSPLLRRAAVSLLLGVRASDASLNDSVTSWSMDEPTTDDSSRSSPRRAGGVSPDTIRGHRRHSMKQYKNELWAAIRPDFMYLMDEEIIDACKVSRSSFLKDLVNDTFIYLAY